MHKEDSLLLSSATPSSISMPDIERPISDSKVFSSLNGSLGIHTPGYQFTPTVITRVVNMSNKYLPAHKVLDLDLTENVIPFAFGCLIPPSPFETSES